jgi:hypothetical protein
MKEKRAIAARPMQSAQSEDVTMKTTHHGSLPLTLAALGALAAGACGTSHGTGTGTTSDSLDQTTLGTAQSFAVLGGSTVTNTGATVVDGNLGVDPGLSITGFPPGLVHGTIHAGDAVALQAQNDVTTAYNTLAGQALTKDLTGQDLGGMTLVAGVYRFSSSAQLTGALTLDAQGDTSSVFVFQIGSTLTTASNSSVLVINGGQDCNVFWQVGSSATLGTTTAFKGNILALASITLNTNANLIGRALARTAAVTMDSNDVSMLACSTLTDGGVDASSGSGGGSDAGSGHDGSSAKDSSGSSSGGDGSSSTSGGDSSSSGSSSGGDAASEAGATLCCGGVLCGASCSDLSADDANCGSCGHACLGSETCSAGTCVSCATQCAGACADLGYDQANCGSCGHACPASALCTAGACVPCATLCAGTCTDLGSRFNCGSCGNVCAASASCTAGACVQCTTLCAGACTDLGSDPLNCGSCGQPCASGESCIGGSCVCQ